MVSRHKGAKGFCQRYNAIQSSADRAAELWFDTLKDKVGRRDQRRIGDPCELD